MSGNDTEEKSLPPSLKKLKDAREKGQVFHSSDMIAGATTTVALIMIWALAASFVQGFEISTAQMPTAISQPFTRAASDVTTTIANNLGVYAFAIALTVGAVSIVVNLMILKGFIFTLEPIKPSLNNLNPIEGFKRIFSLKSLVELIKQILKAIILVSICFFLLLYSLNTALRTPHCTFDCLPVVFVAVIGPVIAVTIGIFLAAGAIDVLVQRWLFTRQLRMTKTEYKRERKDQEGTPEVKSAQRRVRHSFLQPKPNYSVADATLLIEGGGIVVGLRYVRGETPIPLVVCQGREQQAEALINAAFAGNIPIFSDAQLAASLRKKIQVGGYITEDFFDDVAIALQTAMSR